MAEEDKTTIEINDDVEPVTEKTEDADVEAGDSGKDGPLPNVKNPIAAMDGWTVLVALLVTSIIVLIKASIDLGTVTSATWTAGFIADYSTGRNLTIWALVGAVFSVVVVAVLMILKKVNEAASVTATPWIALFLLVVWLAVVLPCTFGYPYTDLGTGWLGCWISLAFSGALAGRAFADKAAALKAAVKKAQGSNEGTKYALFLGVSSVVLLIAAAISANQCGVGTPQSLAFFAVAAAVISMIGCIVILIFANVEALKVHSGKTNMVLSIILIVWWAITAFVVSFGGPYDVLGTTCGNFNGFISVWVSVFMALQLFKACGLDTVKQLVTKIKGGNKGGENAENNNTTEEPASEDPAL